MTSRTGLWAALVLSTALAACGGGGGSAGTPTLGPGSGASAPSAGAPTAAALILSLNKASMSNTGSDTVVATVTAVDANNNVVANAPVTVTVDSGAVVAPSGTTTNASGVMTGTITTGNSRANRSVTVTARSGALTQTSSFQITGARLSATLVPSIVTPGSASNKAQYRLVDANSNAMANETIVITSASLPTVTARTDLNGNFELSYTAPAAPGNITLSATAAGTTLDQVVQVQANSSSVPVVTTPVVGTPTVSANPSVVAVNATGSSNQTQIRALFVGANNARIPNIRVRFDLGGDPNTIGGTLAAGANIVYSDATGVATTAYIPGVRSSPTNGVIVRACWDYSDFAAGSCPNQASTTLTVVADALRVSIGTDELVGSATGTYTKDFVVVVVDAVGQAKADVLITPSLDLLAFYKGFFSWNGTVWAQSNTDITTGDGPYVWNGTSWSNLFGTAGTTPSCPNEDQNRNGIREANEDLNGNLVLDPSGVSITTVGSNRTDANGKAVVRIEYPRDRAAWIDYKITVTAAVAGSEGTVTYVGTKNGVGNLPYPSSAVTSQNSTPAFAISPYGSSAGCTNIN
jgi:hypothetical protein